MRWVARDGVKPEIEIDSTNPERITISRYEYLWVVLEGGE